MKEKVIIFDTTLRDGEQSPGASLNIDEKIEIAQQLSRLNVDVIEAGFPASSAGEFEAVKSIAKKVKNRIIAGLARVTRKDIERAGQALKSAVRPRIHTFIATSAVQMKYKLKMDEKEVLNAATDAVRYARRFSNNVEFSPEDATRTRKQFLYRIIERVIKAGAAVVNIPDTVGYTIPEEFASLIKDIRDNVPNINKAVISVHCHDDLGLAVANSLAAVANGARQVECTINGIGERAGNASLEEIVMSIKTRESLFSVYTGIKTEEIFHTSRLVSTLSGIPVQPNKAIVGANAFAHEAGIHQDGVLKKRTTYEIISPRAVGLKGGRIVLGRHSGRHGLKKRLEDLGHRLSSKDLGKAFVQFKRLADKKKEIFDEDLEAIVEEGIEKVPQTFYLDYIQVSTGNQTIPTATVKISKKGKIVQEASCGDGPVDAVYKAIDRITKVTVNLVDYSLKAVTRGKDAMGEVNIKIEDKNGRLFSGRGLSTDVIESSALAYINAINKLVRK